MYNRIIDRTAKTLCATVFILFNSLVLTSKVSGQISHSVWSDFNGDSFADLVVGVPFEDVGFDDAGAVNVLYGSPTGLDAMNPVANQIWHQNSTNVDGAVEGGDYFGWALATGDFNGDNYDDLAIGVPGEDIESLGAIDAGAVNVLYGTPSGLTANAPADQLWYQSLLIADGSETGDRFGYSLTTGDFNDDGFADLAVGVPFEDLEGGAFILNTGAMNVLFGSPTGLTGPGQFWHQGLLIADFPQPGDLFGYALAAGNFDGKQGDDIAVGVPFEDVGSIDAGAVNVLYGAWPIGLAGPGQFWHQGLLSADGAQPYDRFAYALAAGDFNGDRRDDLAVGVPFEDIENIGINDAGAVNVLYGTLPIGLAAMGNQFWHQNLLSADGAQPYDRFGYALAAGDFDGDRRHDLGVGVPYEDIESIGVNDAGAVNVLYGTWPSGLDATGNQFWNQGHPDIKDEAHLSDLFGYALAAGDFDGDYRDDLSVGVPFEDIAAIPNAGAVSVLYGTLPSGLDPVASVVNQFWNQDPLEGVPEHNDRFGSAVGAEAVNAISSEPPKSDTSRFDDTEHQSEYGKEGLAKESADNAVPLEYALEVNYPNPFNPMTTIQFALPIESFVSLKVYDLLGQEVASLVEENLPAGRHQVVFEVKDLPSGTYVYRIEAGAFTQSRKLTLLK